MVFQKKSQSLSLKLKLKLFLFAFSLFGYGVISLFVSDGTASQTITIPYRAAVLILSIIVIIFCKKSEIINHSTNLTKTKRVSVLQGMTIIFILIYSLRFFYELINNDQLIHPPFQYLLNWFGICLIPGITFLFLNLKHSKKYLYLSWIFLALASVLALPLISQGKISEQGRLTGEALNPISLGHQGGSLLLISLHLLLNKEYLNKKFIKIIYILSIILGLILLFFAASRGPIIAVILCIFLLLFSWHKQGVNTFKILGIIFITIIFANFAFSFALDAGSSLVERFTSLLNGDELGNQKFVQRPELYQKASELIAEYPILGYGLEVPNLGYPHNLILEAFLATGFLGGSLFLITYIYGIIKAISLIMSKKDNSWSWLCLLFIQNAIASMFSGSLYASYSFWYLLFAILGLKDSYSSKKIFS